MKRVLLLLIVATMFLSGCGGSKDRELNISGIVSPGHNSIDWKKKAEADTKTTVKATFTPTTDYEFVPGSGRAVALSDNPWEINPNNKGQVVCKTIVDIEGVKLYPTYFQGSMKPIPQPSKGTAVANAQAPPDLTRAWEATGAFASLTHSYFKVETSRSRFDDSGLKATDWKGGDWHFDYPIFDPEIVPPTIGGLYDVSFWPEDYDPETRERTMGYFYSASNLVRITGDIKCPPTADHGINYMLDCKVVDELNCKIMVRGTFEVIGEHTDKPIIGMPVWNQLTKVTDSGKKVTEDAKNVWKDYLGRVEVHEKKHEAAYRKVLANAWWSQRAKVKHVIEVCVRDIDKAEAIVKKYIKDLETRVEEEFETMIQNYREEQINIDDTDRLKNRKNEKDSIKWPINQAWNMPLFPE